MINPQFYDSQATLDQSRPCYIERQADRDLLAAVLEGTYALLLSSRKMGKSSLIERVFASLRQQPVPFLVAKKEFTLVDKDVTADQWCYGIARDLVRDAQMRCGFTVDPAWQGWWQTEARLAPIERFFAFLREFLLERSEARWVIALDEIETTIPLSFSDDFFASLRACVTGQAGDPALRRLTFILAGVTTPSQLLKDSSRTPFNIGQVISIRDFSPQEAAQLLLGLGLQPDEESPPLLAVLHWTDGHPYLTQRLFKDLAVALQDRDVEDASEVADWPSEVARLVEQRYLRRGVRVTEEHFADIAQRRLEECRKQGIAAGFLRRYRLALGGKSLRDEPLSLAMTQLKLSGLVKPAEDGTLVARNLLYRRVFDQAWVKNEMPANGWKRAAIAASTALITAAAMWVFWLSPTLTRRAATEAEIFSAVRTIALAQSEIPNREQKLLELYTNEQIARSIRKGKDRIPDVGVTAAEYQSLLKYADSHQIAKELWDDYWRRQMEALSQSVARLATTPGSRPEILKTTAEIRETAGRLQAGLSVDERSASPIHDVSGKAMTTVVKSLWAPVDLRIASKPSEAEINRVITAASDQAEKWRALAEVTGALVPLVDDETLKDEFARLVHGQPNQRQNIERADTTAQETLDEVLRQSTVSISGLRPEVRDLNSARKQAHRMALETMVSGSRRPVVHDMGLIICDALESPQEKDSRRQSALGRALASLAARLDTKDTAPLAQQLATAMEKETDSRRQSALGRALASLAARLDTKDAAPLAQRLATAMEKETDSRRQSALGRALASLVARLDTKDAAPLAARGAAVLVTAMEKETDSLRQSALGRALASLAARLDTKDAAPLAARGAAVLAIAMESSDDLRDPGLSLVSLISQLEPGKAAALAGPAAARMIQTLGTERVARNQAAVTSILALWLDPVKATMIASFCATVLTQTEMDNESFDSDDSIIYGLSAASMTARLPPEEAARFAPRAAALITSSRRTTFPDLLKDGQQVLGPKAMTILIQDWINAVAKLQESQPTQREELGQVLEVLRKELSAQP